MTRQQGSEWLAESNAQATAASRLPTADGGGGRRRRPERRAIV